MSEKIGLSLAYYYDLYDQLQKATEDNPDLQKVLSQMFELLFEADIGDCD